MTRPLHSPGPWRWIRPNHRDDTILAAGDGSTHLAYVREAPGPTHEAEANARLIAGAPAVTAAADALLDAFCGDVPDWCREEFDALSRAVRDAYGREF